MLNEYVGVTNSTPTIDIVSFLGVLQLFCNTPFLRKPYVGDGYQDCVHNVLYYRKKMHKTGEIRA